MIVKDKCVLVSGGTGSFGNAVTARFLKEGVGEIRIFSRDEKKQEEMRHAVSDKRVKFYIGDVRDYPRVEQATRGVDYIFHAAALKQVPSCEFYPMEAVRTNVVGADNVMHAAAANRVKRVVVLSTDKAVYPINAMGMSKALMEKAMIANSRAYADSETSYCATRYGNVMASRGSVIPLFISQLKQGKPLTVTDPNMTRYLMSLAESVDLVLHALGQSGQGDIFVQKAPAATISDIAGAIRDIFGRTSEITRIGTRHGEKLFETLVSREEMLRAEDQGKYFKVSADSRDLNYDKYFTEGEIEIDTAEDYTSHNTTRLSLPEVRSLFLGLDIMKENLNAQSHYARWDAARVDQALTGHPRAG